MKVLFIRSNPVSPDPRVEKEADSLMKNGYEVSIVSWNREKNGKNKKGQLKLKNGKVDIEWIQIESGYGNGLKNIYPLLKFQIKLFIYLVRHTKEFDCVHACDFDTVLPANLIAKLLNKKIVYDIFDYYVDAFSVPRTLKPVVEKIDIQMMNSADAVIITNESRKEQIKKSSPKNLLIIHNSPVHTAKTHDKHAEKTVSGRLSFAYFGIFSNGRLLEEILSVFENRKDIELHIGGFGLLEPEVIKASENHENIIYYGKVPYDRVIEVESSCDVLFATYDPEVPNHRFSSPNKLYEAMMLGKPIIVSKGTGLDHLIEEYELGRSIDYTREGFEQAVNEFSGMLPNIEQIYQHVTNVYQEMFSWDIMENRLVDIYHQLEKGR
ncbi:glycosyltransferase family 4 protein [Jeotgalibacillus haloalkalitolerans]|uniref:Glycosyltransferase family 4 protein n=1 Tax=Jeotgalibacillus haloalkalitolerans TaxID=3104292 RepID=A0ABU5KIE6_9BACL|nr:glycosyltransferase family 4 protein [Jeotgalibacillus sp. HH7-29]MDZ5710908.1 glycosyltransferase family 4 protein [Jeotgalibacillus sp. HH7-29]